MSDEAFKAAVRAATEHLLKQKREAEQKREWAFNACPHDAILSFESPPGVFQQACRNCGAERTVFTVP